MLCQNKELPNYGIPKGRLFCHVVLSHFTLLSTSHLWLSKSTSTYNGKFARFTLLKCYNAYCTLLGGQFNIHKLSNSQLHLVKFTTSHCQITIFTSPLLHCKLDKVRLFYMLPKTFGMPPKKSIDCPIVFKSFLCPKFAFLGCFLLGWVGDFH